MNAWQRMFGWLTPRGKQPGPDDDFWYTNLSGRTASGMRVTPEAAQRVVAVMACVRVLAEAIAATPVILYQWRKDGRGKDRAPKHPLYPVLHRSPNDWQTAFEWKEMMMGHAALRGNAYSEIMPGRRGAVDQLIPLHPDRMNVVRLENGRLGYRYRMPDGQEQPYTQDQIFHLRGLSSDGIKGLSPIEMHAESIGLSMAVDRYAAGFFGQSARPAGVLEHPGKLSPDAKKNLRASWNQHYQGADNAHKTAVLEEGLKWTALGVKPEEAQYLESRKFSVSEIARVYRVPPHMIGDLERATFSNIEHQAINFVVHTLTPWFVRWEQAIGRDLIVAEETYFAEFLADALLRGDTKTRYAAYAVGVNWGWLSPNEVRAKENMNPREGGDEYLRPTNMGPSPGNGMPEPSRKEGDDEDDALKLMMPSLIEDASRRIAGAEAGELSKRVDRAAEDPERFQAWGFEFFGRQIQYVAQVLEPLLTAVEAIGGPKVSVAMLADTIINDGRQTLLGSEGVAAIATWAADRYEQIVSRILEAIHNDDRLETTAA